MSCSLNKDWGIEEILSSKLRTSLGLFVVARLICSREGEQTEEEGKEQAQGVE